MPPGRVRLLLATIVAGALMMLATGAVDAQRFFREGGFAARYAPAQMPDSAFVICRLAYGQVRREPSGIGWETDYPYAEINLSTRLSELTRTQDQPRHRRHAELLRRARHRRPALQLPGDLRVGRRDDRVHRSAGGPAPAVLPERRLPLGRRLLGHRRLGELGVPDRPRAAARGISDRRHPAR